MAYHPRNLSRPRYQKSGNPRTKFIVTIIVIAVLLYAMVAWILPTFVGGVTLITGVFRPSQKASSTPDDAALAPPVLNIPFEATNNSTMEIKGYATAGSKVELYLDNDLKDTTTAGDDGSFDFQNVELVLGTNNIFGKTVDDKGRASLPSKTIQITYDNEKPTLEISEPTDGKSVQGDRNLKVSGKTEPEAQIFVNDSQVVLKADGGFETTISLSDGDNQIKIRAVDKAGNTTEEGRKVTFQQ